MARLIKPKKEMSSFDTSTPEGAFNQEIAIKKRDFQKHYDLERNAIIKQGRAKNLGNRQINQYLEQLSTNADRKALELKQEEEIGLIKIRGKRPSTSEQQLQEIGKLEASGGMSPEQANEARTRMNIGPTAASVLYRKQDEPDKPEDPMAQFGKLDVHRNRIEARIKDFRIRPGGGRKKEATKFWFQEDQNLTELETYDPNLLGKDKKGEFTGDWRKATLDEVQEYGALTKEQKRVTAAQRPMMSGTMSAAVNSPRIGGSIQDQAKKYIENRRTRQEPEDFGDMSDEELRQIAGGR